MNRIKLFLTDVDGCLTDGGMYYAENGVDTVCATSHSAADADHRYQDCFAATEELAEDFGVSLLLPARLEVLRVGYDDARGDDGQERRHEHDLKQPV